MIDLRSFNCDLSRTQLDESRIVPFLCTGISFINDAFATDKGTATTSVRLHGIAPARPH